MMGNPCICTWWLRNVLRITTLPTRAAKVEISFKRAGSAIRRPGKTVDQIQTRCQVKERLPRSHKSQEILFWRLEVLSSAMCSGTHTVLSISDNGYR